MLREFDPHDAFFAVGLGGVCVGVAAEFGWAWALIVVGSVLLGTAFFALLRGK
jgi:phage shock protein PspC (stress-responsive transcriptional regulator)